MLRVDRALVLLAAGGVLPCCPPAAAQEPQPIIQLSHREWVFGTIWHQDVPQFSLTVANGGMAPLRILRVQASCGCTAAEPGQYELGPGETTEVLVRYDSKGKQGKQTSTVTIYSNDPATPEAVFHIRGEVKRAVILEPLGGVVIRGLDPYAVQTASARVRNQVDEPLKLRVQSQTTPQFDVTINEITPGQEWEVRATTRPPLGIGTNRGLIVAETGLSREPTISIPISARIFDRVNLVPAAFLFIREDPKPARRGVDVEYYGDGDFRIERVVSSDPSVRVTPGQPRGPAEWQKNLPPTPRVIVPITVDVPSTAKIPAGGAQLEIFTNDPDFPRVAVQITTSHEVFNRFTHGSPRPPAPRPSSAPATTQPAARTP